MKALLLIDIQKGLTKRDLYNKNQFINTVNQSIEKYRATNDLVIFVQHENKQLVAHTNDWEIDENILIEPNDKIFGKQKGNAFTNSELVSFLNQNSVTDIVVSGLVSHGCIYHTCRGGLEKGYSISILKNAHSCWNKDAAQKIKNTEYSLDNLGVNIIDLNTIK